MNLHPTSEHIIFTWGRFKGHSLAHVARSVPSYLQWMSTQEGLPENWKIAATKTLLGEDVSFLDLPRTNNTISHVHIDQDTTKTVEVILVDKKTAAVIMPYDKTLLAKFKYEIDGRKWNPDEKHWEFPLVHLPKFFSVFPHAKCKKDVLSKLEELQTRRQDLDEIRIQEDDVEYAKQFNNIVQVGKVLNWNKFNTNLQIEFEIDGKQKKLTEDAFIKFLEQNEYTLDVHGNICKNTGVLKLPLYGYQVIGTKFIDRADGRCLIADAPGLGKTVQAIAYAHHHNLKTLIVCPLSVVINWQREIKKFTGKGSTI